MPPSRSRRAWLEPLEVDESPDFFAPPHWKDVLALDHSAKAYSSVALAGIFMAALATGLGLGRPAVLAVVAVGHCVVVGIVYGGAAVSARVWPAVGEAESRSSSS